MEKKHHMIELLVTKYFLWNELLDLNKWNKEKNYESYKFKIAVRNLNYIQNN